MPFLDMLSNLPRLPIQPQRRVHSRNSTLIRLLLGVQGDTGNEFLICLELDSHYLSPFSEFKVFSISTRAAWSQLQRSSDSSNACVNHSSIESGFLSSEVPYLS